MHAKIPVYITPEVVLLLKCRENTLGLRWIHKLFLLRHETFYFFVQSVHLELLSGLGNGESAALRYLAHLLIFGLRLERWGYALRLFRDGLVEKSVEFVVGPLHFSNQPR